MLFFSKDEMLAHQVCMVFIWKVFKSQNKISIYSPSQDFLSLLTVIVYSNISQNKAQFFISYVKIKLILIAAELTWAISQTLQVLLYIRFVVLEDQPE